MDARIRRAPPVPHRRLVLLLLAEGELVTGWRSSILGADLYQLLAATRTCSLILLFLGLPESYELPRVQRPIRAILFAALLTLLTTHDACGAGTWHCSDGWRG